MDSAKRGSCPQCNPPTAVEGDTPQQVVVLQLLSKHRWINCCNCYRKMHVLAKLEITMPCYAPVCTFHLRLLLLLRRCRCSSNQCQSLPLWMRRGLHHGYRQLHEPPCHWHRFPALPFVVSKFTPNFACFDEVCGFAPNIATLWSICLDIV